MRTFPRARCAYSQLAGKYGRTRSSLAPSAWMVKRSEVGVYLEIGGGWLEHSRQWLGAQWLGLAPESAEPAGAVRRALRRHRRRAGHCQGGTLTMLQRQREPPRRRDVHVRVLDARALDRRAALRESGDEATDLAEARRAVRRPHQPLEERRAVRIERLKRKLLRRRPAGSPEASFSASSCPKLRLASANPPPGAALAGHKVVVDIVERHGDRGDPRLPPRVGVADRQGARAEQPLRNLGAEEPARDEAHRQPVAPHLAEAEG